MQEKDFVFRSGVDIIPESIYESAKAMRSSNVVATATSPSRIPALTMPLIGLAKPVGWHSSRVSAVNTTALTPYEVYLVKSRFRNWYRADWDYALTTVYFFCAAIGIFTFFNVYSVRRSRRGSLGRGVASKLTALFRYLSARQFYVRVWDWYSPSLGAIFMLGSLIVFVLGLSFAVRPYYWPNKAMGNSPPLGTRTGWISIAIMPFLFAFSSKLNFIGILTGTSHEKLQVYHRWTAWIMYLTSLLHTFPFIVWNIKLGQMELFYKGKSYYWTGIAALIPQTWLVFMSWGPIRSRYYETFKKIHFLASMIFMGFLFLHCNWRLSSWDYFWATTAIFALAWLLRFGRMLLINGFINKASVELVGGGMLKVHVITKLKWKPGQHFFVRFTNTGAHILTSHPFTVASIPSSGTMEFLVRPQSGITGRLVSLANTTKPSYILLDGPYGGVHKDLTKYNTVLLLAGGSGASFTMPILFDLCDYLKREKVKPINIIFVWAVKVEDLLSSYQSVFDQLQNKDQLNVTVQFYITSEGRSFTPSDEDEKGKTIPSMETRAGRPNIRHIIAEAFAGTSSLAVAVCGPNSFTFDARNTVANHQLAIAKGKASCTDLYLHAEPYSW